MNKRSLEIATLHNRGNKWESREAHILKRTSNRMKIIGLNEAKIAKVLTIAKSANTKSQRLLSDKINTHGDGQTNAANSPT